LAVEGTPFRQFTKYISGGEEIAIRVPFVMISNLHPNNYIKQKNLTKYVAHSIRNRLVIIQAEKFNGDNDYVAKNDREIECKFIFFNCFFF
jgi:hypothetical protein